LVFIERLNNDLRHRAVSVVALPVDLIEASSGASLS
jgi:hypothetical protein